MRRLQVRSPVFLLVWAVASVLPPQAVADARGCFEQTESESPARMSEARLELAISERVRSMAGLRDEASRLGLDVSQLIEVGIIEGQKVSKLHASAERIAGPRSQWRGLVNSIRSLDRFWRPGNRPTGLARSVIDAHSAIKDKSQLFLETRNEIDILRLDFDSMAAAALAFPRLSRSRSLAISASAALDQLRSQVDISEQNARTVESILRGQIAQLGQLHRCATNVLCRGELISVIKEPISRDRLYSDDPIALYMRWAVDPTQAGYFEGFDENGSMRVRQLGYSDRTDELRVLPAEVITHHALVSLRSGSKELVKLNFRYNATYENGINGYLNGLFPDRDHWVHWTKHDAKGRRVKGGSRRVDSVQLTSLWSAGPGAREVLDFNYDYWWYRLGSIEGALAALGYDLRRLTAADQVRFQENNAPIYAVFQGGRLVRLTLGEFETDSNSRGDRNRPAERPIIKTFDLAEPLEWAPYKD